MCFTRQTGHDTLVANSEGFEIEATTNCDEVEATSQKDLGSTIPITPRSRSVEMERTRQDVEDPRIEDAYNILKTASQQDECDIYGQLVAKKNKRLFQDHTIECSASRKQYFISGWHGAI
ncbi:hypothetical protein PR048_015716 [Dryococelus australis]|uniref:Uncharacterized protein n=1 Tax=Dryococelus australis TaxID=614101 RepID=A0ABQ9HHP9_9NEOP|nr:hypothetical protein PR048_015716 [Dryococelus australis]